MFLFDNVGKDPLNSFLALGVKALVFRGVPGIIDQLLIDLPDMVLDVFCIVFRACA